MKWLFFIFGFQIMIHAQSNDLHDIKKVLSKQQSDWNAGDIDGFMQGYWKSDSLTFVGSKGLTYGWTNTLNNYKKSYPDKAAMGKLEFEIMKLDLVAQNVAHMIGRYTLRREKDSPTGIFTLIWRKFGNHWVIISDQTCG